MKGEKTLSEKTNYFRLITNDFLFVYFLFVLPVLSVLFQFETMF